MEKTIIGSERFEETAPKQSICYCALIWTTSLGFTRKTPVRCLRAAAKRIVDQKEIGDDLVPLSAGDNKVAFDSVARNSIQGNRKTNLVSIVPGVGGYSRNSNSSFSGEQRRSSILELLSEGLDSESLSLEAYDRMGSYEFSASTESSANSNHSAAVERSEYPVGAKDILSDSKTSRSKADFGPTSRLKKLQLSDHRGEDTPAVGADLNETKRPTLKVIDPALEAFRIDEVEPQEIQVIDTFADARPTFEDIRAETPFIDALFKACL